jgi:hypothetical protein
MSAPKGIHYALDYSIQDLNVLTSAGQKFNFKQMMTSLTYYEDIYSFVTSGTLTVTDAQGFVEAFQLTGNEFLEVNIGKIKDAPDNIIETFRIYKITKRKPTGSQKSETYELNFCSEELFLSEQTKISQSYPNKTVTEIINDILTDKLKINKNKIENIETTTGVYDFVVPNMKPFEAISWLSTYARPKSYPGSDMLFYQTRDGFNFRSLQSIFNDDVFSTYKYSAKNLDLSQQQTEEQQINIQKFEILKSYDSLNEINVGTLANRLVSIDPLIRSYHVTDFDYTKYHSNAATLNPNAPTNYFTNRLGQAQNETYLGTLKVATSNKDELKVDYISARPGSVAKDIFIETYVPLRTAQISLANYTKIKLTIPGDVGITVGKVISFNMSSLDPLNKTPQGDKFYSGNYIVTAVRHIFTAERLVTMIEIAKDSSSNKYQSINTTTDWTEAISA